MSVAVTSLPVPLSPVTSTVLSLLPITCRNSNTARIRALCPTTTASGESVTEMLTTTSTHPERIELGHLLAQRQFDTEVERHVGARTAGTHAGEPHIGAVAIDRDQFDVAAIGLHERPHPRQDRFDALSGDHDHVRGQPMCHQRGAGFPGISDGWRQDGAAETGTVRNIPRRRVNPRVQTGFSSVNFSTE